MSRMLIVVGDALQRGGAVLSGSPHTDIDGRAVARVGDKVLCTRHGAGAIVTGDPTLLIDGQAVARNGDKASCGCVLLAGKQPLVHVSQGGGGGAARALAPATAFADSLRPTASPSAKPSPLINPGAETLPSEQCWVSDHSQQVLENPDGRYFETHGPDDERYEYDLVASFRIDVPLRSGGDVVVTAKIKVVTQGRVTSGDVEAAKERLKNGIDRGLNEKFTLQITDDKCGTRTYPIRYVVEFVTTGEDYVMRLHDRYEREEVIGNIIYVSIDTDAWVHLHEFMHCLGLPDEYMDPGDDATTIRYFMPNRMLSRETVTTRSSWSESDPDATLMSVHHNEVLKPRHAWNIGLEVQKLLSREIGRGVICDVAC
ncbi:PAAR domain-containing protein [Stenotrophomonas sp. LARHCG68]